MAANPPVAPFPPAAPAAPVAPIPAAALVAPIPGAVNPVLPPRMGGLAQTSPTEQTAWTGGQPDYAWTSLAALQFAGPESPNQLRPTHVGHAQKAYGLRKTGLTPKFAEKADFVRFIDRVWDHLQDTGMDTIAYLPDSEAPTTMASVVKSHSRFALDYVKNAARIQVAQYDHHDKLNDKQRDCFC